MNKCETEEARQGLKKKKKKKKKKKTIVFFNILRFKTLSSMAMCTVQYSPLYLDYNDFLLKLNEAFLHW